jgi:2-polyprenyl-3-methyl-5-hydroxy-6-metoxy-1,4-benzoquinol methylase
VSTTDANRGFQKIYAADGKSLLSDGWWDPKELLGVLNRCIGDETGNFWAGKRVLDIGANSCGLSVEIARRGASLVCVEPDVRAIDRFNQVRPQLAPERLEIEVNQGTLKDALGWKKTFDAVLFLGLLYHFKYPQYIINSLATIPSRALFISTQCTAGDGLSMVNRLQEMPARMRATMTELTGWHLTRNLLKRMLEDAGYKNVREGSDPSMTFANKPTHITNSTYMFAERQDLVSRSSDDNADEFLKYYPR